MTSFQGCTSEAQNKQNSQHSYIQTCLFIICLFFNPAMFLMFYCIVRCVVIDLESETQERPFMSSLEESMICMMIAAETHS